MTDFIYSRFYLVELAGEDPPAVHARFTEMIAYLQRVAPANGLPGRQHIDPCDFPKVLRLVNLIDVERSGAEVCFRYRLMGETQTLNAGRDITGMLVEEAIAPPLAARINANMRLVLETRMPVYDRFPMPHPDREFIDSQRMYYPLAKDGETIDMLLILNGYDSDRSALQHAR
jgi:hypothetical protein